MADKYKQRPKAKKPDEPKKELTAEQKAEIKRAEEELKRRRAVMDTMQKNGFPITDETVIDFMIIHYEALETFNNQVGRQTKYWPILDEWAIWLGQRGYSLKQMAVIFGISYVKLWEWGKQYPSFGEALVRAREASQAWWETLGQAALFSKDFNTYIWNKIVSTRFRADYTDRKGLPYDPKAPDDGEQLDSGVVTLNLKALSEDQRRALALAIEGQVEEESE